MTSEVSKQLPYQPIEPLPIEKEPCLLFCKISNIFFTHVTLSALGILLGVAIAFQAAFLLLPAGIIGGVTGFTIGIALSIFQKNPSSAEAKYRIQTLEQLEKTQNSPQLLETIQKVKAAVSANSLIFEQAHDNHALHNSIMKITQTVSVQKRPDIQKVWKTFLSHMHGLTSHYPCHTEMKLDFSFELDRLEGKKAPDLIIEKLEAADFKTLEGLQLECFGKAGFFPKEMLSKMMKIGYIARSKIDNAILGFVWVTEGEKNRAAAPSYSIAGLGRKANASGLKIGEQLLNKLFEENPKVDFSLKVRQSNRSASELYRKLGFKAEATAFNYYTYPKENAITMIRPHSLQQNVV